MPAQHENPLVQQLRKAMQGIARSPYLGFGESELTLNLGREVRSRLSGNYRIYYVVSRPIPEIFAILHTSCDLRETLANRAQ